MSIKVASLHAELTVDSKKFDQGLNTAKGSLTLFSGSTLKSIGSLVGITSALAVGGMAFNEYTKFIKASITAAAEAQRAEAQLGAVLKSTGGIAGLTAKDIIGYSKELQDLSGIEDDYFTKMQAIMLTFTRVTKDTFKEATIAALDMSVALGTDMQGAVIMVGKALNVAAGDVAGASTAMSAMKRVGVAFTTDQIELAKKLIETGDAAGYQALILQELNTEFGGSAAAQLDTYAGKQEALRTAFGNLQETIGNDLLPELSNLTDNLIILTNWINTNYEAIQNWIDIYSTIRSLGLNKVFEFIAGGVKTLGDETINTTVLTNEMSNSLGGLSGSAMDSGVAVIELKEEFGRLEDDVYAATGGVIDFSGSLDEGAEELKDYKAQLDTVTSGAKMLDEQQKNLKNSVDMMKEAERAYVEYKREHPFDTVGIKDMRQKWVDLAGAVEDVQETNRLQTAEWISNIVLQQLSLDGLSEDEMGYYLQYMIHAGLMTEESAETAKLMYGDALKIAGGFGETTGAIDTTSDALNNVPKKIDVTITPHGITETETQANNLKIVIGLVPKDTEVRVNPRMIRETETQAKDLSGAIGTIPKSTAIGVSTNGMKEGVGQAYALRDAIWKIPTHTDIWIYYHEVHIKTEEQQRQQQNDVFFKSSSQSSSWMYDTIASNSFIHTANSANQSVAGSYPQAQFPTEMSLSKDSIRNLADTLFYKLQAVI